MAKAIRPRRAAINEDMPQTRNRTLVARHHPDDEMDPSNLKPAARRRVTVNCREHVIDWLHHRKLISAGQFKAAEQLRYDYERAGLSPSVTMRWDQAASRGGKRSFHSGGDRPLIGIDAKKRFDAALAAAGPGLSEICWRIICAGESMAVAEQGLGWPTRSGRVVLGIALDRLKEYYGVGEV